MLAQKAVDTANVISRVLAENSGSLSSLTDQDYFDLVEANLRPRTDILGSGIVLAPNVHPPRRLWGPYAVVDPSGEIETADLSRFYDYTNPLAEWYGPLATRTSWGNINVQSGRCISVLVSFNLLWLKFLYSACASIMIQNAQAKSDVGLLILIITGFYSMSYNIHNIKMYQKDHM